MNIGEAFVQIRPDTRGFEGQVESGIGASFRKVAGIAAAAFGAVKIGGFLKDAIEEARESERVMRLTENAIRATGGAANVTASDVSDLANRLSGVTAIDDEVIQQASNMILTFKNVRNEVGAGNDIFNRANAAALDLSVQFGGVDSAAKQLGKALNDPIAGISALARAGVTFTEQQKEQIKTLVESGDVLAAQKIILGEVESQVGGAAAAAADPMQKLGVVVGNLKEQLGLALLPAISAAATYLGEHLPGAMVAVQGAFDALIPKVQQFAEWFSVNILPTLREMADYLVSTVWPAIQQGVEALGGWEPVLIAAGVALAAIIAPLGVLAAAAVYVYTEFEGFRAAVDAVVAWFQGTAVPAIEDAAASLAETFAELVVWVEEHWAAIEEAIGHVIVAVQAVIETFVDYVTVLWEQWGDEIANITGLVWDQISLLVETAVNLIRGVIETVTALINGDWGEAWEGIKDILSTAWDFIVDYVGNAVQIVGQLVEGALSALRTIWNIAWDAIGAALSAAWDAMVQQVTSAIGNITEFFSALPGRILAAVGNLASTLTAKGAELLAGFLTGIVNKAQEVWSWLGDLPGMALRAVGNLARVLYNKGRELVQGFIDGVRSLIPSAEDVVDFIGGLASGLGFVSLAGVQSAQEAVDNLRDEGFRLARQIERAERDVTRAAASDRAVTREEELAILNARDRQASAREALRAAQRGFAAGEVSADELRRAEIQAEIATQNLADATEQATALGSAFDEATRTLENLREQQARLAEQTADALADLAEAQRDLAAARAEHQSIINTQLQAQLDAEAKRAAEALVTPEEQLRILRAQQSAIDAEQRAIWARADPNMPGLQRDIIELELTTAMNALAEAIRASTAVTTPLPGGPAPDFGGGEGVQSAGVHITVLDRSGNPTETARSTALALRMA